MAANGWPPDSLLLGRQRGRDGVSSRVNVDDERRSSHQRPRLVTMDCWMAKASRSWSGVLCGRRGVILRRVVRAGFRAPKVAGQKLPTAILGGVIHEISEAEVLRLSKPVSRYGLPRYSHPVGCYRTAWGTWYGLFKHRGRRYYLGTRATAAEAYADVLAARVALGAPGSADSSMNVRSRSVHRALMGSASLRANAQV